MARCIDESSLSIQGWTGRSCVDTYRMLCQVPAVSRHHGFKRTVFSDELDDRRNGMHHIVIAGAAKKGSPPVTLKSLGSSSGMPISLRAISKAEGKQL